MAIGQAVINSASVADAGVISIRPAEDVEWVIHNILVPEGADIQIIYYDGSTATVLESATGSYFDVHFHTTYAKYYQVKNVSGGSKIIGYDGVVTYEGV
jgi:hypothetical protein